MVTIVDENGILIPSAKHKITDEVTGAGRLGSMDNGNLSCSESYIGTSRSAWKGRAMAIIQSSRESGEIKVTVTADGLEPATVTIKSK